MPLRWILPLLALLPAGSAAASLPLGDGKISTQAPRMGWIYSCTQPAGGGGAFRDGPWIRGDGSWDPEVKIAVQGHVTWRPSFRSQLQGRQLLLSGNGLPAWSGRFPIASDDPAYTYDRNPNSVRSWNLSYRLSARPRKASRPSCLPLGPIGVSRNGVALFNGLDGEGRDAVAHEIQDGCQGHPERSGAYHYHSASSCLIDPGRGHSRLLGWALDGFGIYGRRGSRGRTMANAQLDVCHGHQHRVRWQGRGQRIYHYHATAEYPYTLGCYRGTPKSNRSQLPPPPQPGG